mgnify:CR=1 FL=1|jgi:hypothetical protein
MNITPEQARQSLDTIDEAEASLQKVFERQSGRIVLGWGIAYFFGPLAAHFLGNSGFLILHLLLLGAIGVTVYESSRKAIASGPGTQYFGAAWGVLYGFGAIWFIILSPWGWSEVNDATFQVISKQMWGYGVTLAMFAYTLMGLWMDRIYLWIGLSVTATVLIGQFLLSEWYWLWCAGTNGGIMLLGAFILLRRARRK